MKKQIFTAVVVLGMAVPSFAYAQNVENVFAGLEDFVENNLKTQAVSLPNAIPTGVAIKPVTSDNAKITGKNIVNNSNLSGSELRNIISKYAQDQLGKPYKYAAAGPDQFDCSGLILHTFNTAGVQVPRTSQAQSEVGTLVDKKDLQVGDIVFFDTRNTANLKDISINTSDTLTLFDGENLDKNTFKLGKVTHSGIYIGDGKFVHASSGSVMKVVVEDLESKYFAQRYLFAKSYF